MQTFTVVAAYNDPPSLYCETVQAVSPEAATEGAWQSCRDANGWGEDMTADEAWTDSMVIDGPVRVVG